MSKCGCCYFIAPFILNGLIRAAARRNKKYYKISERYRIQVQILWYILVKSLLMQPSTSKQLTVNIYLFKKLKNFAIKI